MDGSLQCMLRMIKGIGIVVLLMSGSSSEAVIHIFGDSHAAFGFTNKPSISPHEESIFIHKGNIKVPMIIDWNSCTMHKVGRDGLSYLDIRKFGVRDGDICVFTFGEIDVRMHIGRQRDVYKRALNEILDTLLGTYMRTIRGNLAFFKDITCVLVSTVPPATNAATQLSPSYPIHGTAADRVNIAKKLNKCLEVLAAENGFLFLNIYPLFADANGVLMRQLSDGHVHVNIKENYRIKNLLIELLIKNDALKERDVIF